ncbi:hypothetical protein WKK05_32740 [Nostoc sp. UHCC 0302]|uniref:hypothetical protein n=1 Tax=Nostoc sp. UHCC 0302 TaxID=3134896 RepID=UPI00311CBE63
MRLKRWESPRKEGRNDKGRGGSARKRQLRKQRQMLRQKLKEANKVNSNKSKKEGEENVFFPLFFRFVSSKNKVCIFHNTGFL